MIILIAAVAKNNVIEKEGRIPWNIPEEMALFKKTTMGHTLIVGRKTHESIGHALPGRRTIVLSRTMEPLSSPTLSICGSIAEALEEAKGAKKVFVIGGQEIYAQMMPLADEMLISHLHASYEGNSFFPPIDPTVWKLSESKEFLSFIHSRYTRI